MRRAKCWSFLLLASLAPACAGGRAPAPGRGPVAVETPTPAARPLIGAILPQSGSPALEQYGALVLEGIRLALDSASLGGRPAPELVVLDDAGDAERDPALVKQLEARGALAVIGPLLSQGVLGGARARSDTALVLISPTASSLPPGLANVYTLNQPDLEGVAELGRYALREGVRRFAVLYPRMGEYEGKAQAFASALRGGGGALVADVPYDSGTTTFRAELRRVAAAVPEGLAVFAPERDVRQLAPQIAYYGVSGRGLRLFGGENWTSDEILRLVSPRYTNGVVASTPLVKESPAAAWLDFTQRYERAYKRTLDTPFPALGYDAARLVISALPGGRTAPRRSDVARRLATVRGFRGATGVLATRAGAIVRQPFVVRIEDGKTIPLVTPGMEGGRP